MTRGPLQGVASTPDHAGPPRGLAPVIFALTATGLSVNMLVIAALPEIATGVGARPEQAGLVLAAAAMPGVVLGPVLGFLADRHGRRVVLIPSLLLIAAGGGLAVTAPSLVWLLGWRLLQGIGATGAINLAIVLIGDHWTGSRRAAMLGRNAAVMTVSTAVFPLLGGAVTDAAGAAALFGVYLLAAGTAVLVVVHLPAATAPASAAGQLGALRAALRGPGVVRALVAAGVAFALIFGLVLTVLPLHLQAAFALSPTMRGLVLAAPAVASAGVALGAGRLQRFPKRALLSTAAVLFAVGLAGAATAPTLVLLVAAIVFFGAGQGLMVPNLHDIAARSSHTGRGAMVSLLLSSSRLGQTVGPVVAGAGLTVLGAPGTFTAGAGIAVLVLLPVVLPAFPTPPAAPAAGDADGT